MSPTSDAKLTEYVTLVKEQRALESRQEEIAKRMAQLQETILERWVNDGQTSAALDGFTVYIANDFVCSKKAGVATDDVCAVLEKNGLGNLVAPGYNAQSLKSWVKEQLSNQQPLPDDLEPMLNYQEIMRLRARLK